MRRLASILVSSALALLLCAAGTPAAHATPRVFEGSLTVSLGAGGPAFFSDTVNGEGTADVTLNSDGIDQFYFPAGTFQFDGVARPLPLGSPFFPLESVSLDAQNGRGGFGGLTTPSGVGFMTIEGAFFFGSSFTSPDPFWVLPTYDEDEMGIGLAGVFDFFATNGFTGQLQANDWTTDSVTNDLGTFSGFSNGNSMRLVSPFVYLVFVQGNPTLSTTLPGVAILDLNFVEPVPEPGTAVLLASGMLLLGTRARAARRGGSAKTRC